MPTRLFGEESHHFGMQLHKEPHFLGVEPESVSRRALFQTQESVCTTIAVSDAGAPDLGSELAVDAGAADLGSELAVHARGRMVRQVTGQVLRVFRRKLVKSTSERSIVSCDLRGAAEPEHKERYNNNCMAR